MWEQSVSGRVRHRFEPLTLIATLAMIPVLVIEYDTTSRAAYVRRHGELGHLGDFLRPSWSLFSGSRRANVSRCARTGWMLRSLS
jgi:hypothetical protein